MCVKWRYRLLCWQIMIRFTWYSCIYGSGLYKFVIWSSVSNGRLTLCCNIFPVYVILALLKVLTFWQYYGSDETTVSMMDGCSNCILPYTGAYLCIYGWQELSAILHYQNLYNLQGGRHAAVGCNYLFTFKYTMTFSIIYYVDVIFLLILLVILIYDCLCSNFSTCFPSVGFTFLFIKLRVLSTSWTVTCFMVITFSHCVYC